MPHKLPPHKLLWFGMLIVGLALFSQELLGALSITLILVGSLVLSAMSRLGLLVCAAALVCYGIGILDAVQNGGEATMFGIFVGIIGIFFLISSWICTAIAWAYRYWQSRKAL